MIYNTSNSKVNVVQLSDIYAKKLTDYPIASGGTGTTFIEFILSPEWTDAEFDNFYPAYFVNGVALVLNDPSPLDDNFVALVPPEALNTPGLLEVGIYATFDEENTDVKTSSLVRYEILRGAIQNVVEGGGEDETEGLIVTFDSITPGVDTTPGTASADATPSEVYETMMNGGLIVGKYGTALTLTDEEQLIGYASMFQVEANATPTPAFVSLVTGVEGFECIPLIYGNLDDDVWQVPV